MLRGSPRYIILGQLRRDFAILPDGGTLLDTPGGNMLYAASGLAVWKPDGPVGLVGRVGEDYPREWINECEKRGMDTLGVRVLPEAIDLRSFYVYKDRNTRMADDPVGHFARLGLPFPRELLGYRAPTVTVDSHTRLQPTSLRQGDLPEAYRDASSAHLCPVDFLTHSLMPAVLRQAGFTTITLDPPAGVMTPTFWDDFPALVTGLTAFLPSEEELHALFHGRSTDSWEMMEAIGRHGCEFVVVKRGERGQWLYDSASQTRWEVSAYPARVTNPTGAGDAFCGGFLIGYRRTYDPIEAVLYGNISASLVVEGNGPFFALDVLPSLPQARLEALRDTVRKL